MYTCVALSLHIYIQTTPLSLAEKNNTTSREAITVIQHTQKHICQHSDESNRVEAGNVTALRHLCTGAMA
jgi:hypothetical protein